MGLFDNIKTLVGNKNPAQTVPTPSQGPAKKVLIAEDDQYLRDFYCELLKGEGFDVTTAENGQVGLEKVKTINPDIVLLDLMMPVMDGKAMLHAMRQIPEFKLTPVIVLTNAGNADNLQQTKVYDNASDFLIKSNVNPEEIISKVKTYVSV